MAFLLLIAWGAISLLAPSALPDFLRVGQPQDAPAVYSPAGRISFVRTSADSTKRDLFVVNPDSSNQQQVTSGMVIEGTTVWSSDGRRMIAQATINKVERIIRVDIGPDNKPSNLMQLTADITVDSVFPALSPNGTAVAFQSKKDGGDYQVYLMDIDGNNKRRISDGKGFAGQPAWSPDGKSIVYIAGADSQPTTIKELYVVPASGGAARQLTALGKPLLRPQWSPDGKLIICIQGGGDRDKAILSINAQDGSAQTLVPPGMNQNVQISPVGGKIAYDAVVQSGGSGVFTIPQSGGNPTSLSAAGAGDYSPAWSPDGSRLAWSDGSRIVVANADGSNRQTISQGNGTDTQPAWGPAVKVK